MGLSFGHILILLVVVLVVFGVGKLPNVMGDLGKGLRNFKDGLKGEDEKKDDTAEHKKAD
jgi:sec-independent protein translocase protein TatA